MNRRQRGFTLVELLIALAASGLLISLTYGSIVLGQRSAQALQAQVADSDTLMISWQLLQDAIAGARPIQNPNDPDDRTSFSGEAGKLAFVANLPAYARPGGLTHVEFALETRDDRKSLIVRLTPFPPQNTDTNAFPPREAVLVDALASLQIHYLGRTGNGSLQWHAAWTDSNALPNLIRIQVSPVQSAPWPALVLRPRTGAVPIQAERPEDITGPAPHDA